jgi:hypothetical protein
MLLVVQSRGWQLNEVGQPVIPFPLLMLLQLQPFPFLLSRHEQKRLSSWLKIQSRGTHL